MTVSALEAGEDILIVEDDELLRRALSKHLASAGYQPHQAGTGAEAMDRLAAAHVDLVLLDLNLPDTDGFTVVDNLRRTSDVPVIVVSVRHDEKDKIRALDGGADDYVTKPLHGEELLARIRAALRRHRGMDREVRRFVGGLDVDVAARSVTVDSREIALTRTEWSLFEQLMSRPGVLQTHGELLRRVWGIGFEGDSHYVRVYVASLRRKLADDARNPRFIATQQGVGYRWIGQAQR